MTTKANILELNGKPYDALTGMLMADHPAHRAVKAIDGFINTPRHMPVAAHHAKPAPSAYKTPSNDQLAPSHSRAFDIHHHHAAQANHHHHQQQRATTLMRHVVHRPAASLKRYTKVTVPTDILSKLPQFDVIPKHSISSIDQQRLKRAERIAKSKLVSRFGNFISQPHTAAQPPVAQPIKATAVAPAIVRRQPSNDIFERALARATSHTQPVIKHPKKVTHKSRLRRMSSFTAASLAVLVIVGFVAFQNVAQIQFNMASNRAGIHAVLPKWQPSGFAIGTVHASPGTVSVSFRATNANKSFSLVQTATKWNNTALFDNFVFPVSNSYETVQTAGTTIYTYNNNDATWVNKGIWYKLISNGALSSSQLVTIAVSM